MAVRDVVKKESEFWCVEWDSLRKERERQRDGDITKSALTYSIIY